MKQKKMYVIVVITLLFALLANYTVLADEQAADTGNTDTKYRIQPILDQLAQMDSAVIDNNLQKYSDMSKHWSRQVVGKLTGLDIISGTGGKFLPDKSVNADEFVKMAVRAMGYKLEEGVKYWAQPYIDMALKEGIIVKGEFPDYKKPLSREEMARIIVRTTLKVDEKPDGKLDQYIMGKVSDYHSIADSMKQYVLDSYKIGLVSGDGNKFYPKKTLTRAEAAAVVIRFLDVTERTPMKPGPDEIIKTVDSMGKPVEIYPGEIRELFTVAKAAQDAIPKAKGYVRFFIGSDGKHIGADMYKDKTSYEQSIFNMVASFDIAYNDDEVRYLYDLTVWQDDMYKQLFSDYMRTVLKTLFEADSQKAVALHDKYMNALYTRTDGYNDYTETRLNNRNTVFLRYDGNSFAIQIKQRGIK